MITDEQWQVFGLTQQGDELSITQCAEKIDKDPLYVAKLLADMRDEEPDLFIHSSERDSLSKAHFGAHRPKMYSYDPERDDPQTVRKW
jgi:hypothetical protein